jgi:hypothetical protein
MMHLGHLEIACYDIFSVVSVALTMTWMVWSSNPGGRGGGGVRYSDPIQNCLGVHPAFCTVGTRSLSGG